MLQQIADLVEFDLKRFSEAQILEDFNHKFAGSILKIDGYYIKTEILEKRAKTLVLHTFDKEGLSIEIKFLRTIEKVQPKTGLYASDYGLLYLNRKPKRQWIKSLSLGNNYEVHILQKGNKEVFPDVWNTVLVDNTRYAKETIIYKDIVYLHWLKVGKVFNDTIHVTNKKFIEEIKELWNPQYQIILDANLPQPKVEKLVLDF